MLHRIRRLGSLALVLVMLWLAGLGWFVASSVLVQIDRASATDAIIVLTGGRLRLEAGVELLAAGKAQKLFVSGVNPLVDRDTLLRALGPVAEREACCIIIGRAADTFGNAQETANWIREEGYRSLRLVTSWYHMRRSLLEFSRAMPHITMIAHPVFPPSFGAEGGWRGWLTAMPLVIGEYHKFVGAWLRPLIGLAPSQPPAVEPVVRTTAGLGEAEDGYSRAPLK